MKNPVAVSPRVPAQRFSALGESDPKARPRGVVDGKLVNIPVLPCNAMGGRRRLGNPPVGWWFKRLGVHSRQIRSDYLRRDDEALRAEVADTLLPRKVPKLQLQESVPETDTGGRGEYPKAFERTRVKELGKLVP